MRTLPRFALLAVASCVAAWAQSGSADAPSPQASQPSQPVVESPIKPSPDKVASPGALDSAKLEVIKSEGAIYPVQARFQQLQGQVMVKMFITEQGDVERVELVSGDPVLAESALNAARKWKFKPYIKNGAATKVSVKVPFDFHFSDKVTDIAPKPVHISPGLVQGMLIHRISPVYPADALQARIQGIVLLQATIGKDGRIKSLSLISGHPMLTQAAIGAVQQWRYKPYLLKGDPVDVDTQIQVNFQLH